MIDVYAHRGLHQLERENTLGAFRAAVALGVDGVELDVRRTLDGALVVHHDAHIDSSVIAHTLAADLPGYVPSLDAAMTALAEVRVNVEIKNIQDPSEPTYDPTGTFVRQVLDALSKGGWSHRVIISCFDEATCVQVRDAAPDIDVGWLLWDVDVMTALTRASDQGLTAVHPHFRVLDEPVMERARELDIDVNVWTVNHRADIETVARRGVSSIISDDPDLVASVLGELGLRTGR